MGVTHPRTPSLPVGGECHYVSKHSSPESAGRQSQPLAARLRPARSGRQAPRASGRAREKRRTPRCPRPRCPQCSPRLVRPCACGRPGESQHQQREALSGAAAGRRPGDLTPIVLRPGHGRVRTGRGLGQPRGPRGAQGPSGPRPFLGAWGAGLVGGQQPRVSTAPSQNGV